MLNFQLQRLLKIGRNIYQQHYIILVQENIPNQEFILFLGWKTYKKWFCIKCDNNIEVGTIHDLKDHWLNVHNAPPKYQCIVCDKVYEKFDLFRKHINAHRDKYKYK